MRNRICPSEETLSMYLYGLLSGEDRSATEKHLAGCSLCRRLIVETYEVTSLQRACKKYKTWFGLITKNRWFIGALAALALSFFFPAYFFQFLTACLLMGSKWIIDMKTTKTLIMIHEAWKRGDKAGLDKELSRFKHFTF